MTQFKRSIAIIIGINQYQNGIPALKTAVNDATQLAQVLKADHGYQVVLLRDQQASLATLRSLLTDKLAALVQPDDRVLFYFAGHGLAFNGDEGPEGYLIPQDAKLGDSATYLPMTLVHDGLTALACRHFLGIFDCCFAGAFRWSATRRLSPIPAVIHKERFARFLSDPAWQVLTSAADDQEAADALSIKDHRGVAGRHSPFAEALINALQANSQADASPPPRDGKPAGDGVITATELYQYLRDAVEPATSTRSMRQTPGLWPLKNHGKGEFIFMVPGRQPDLPAAPKLNEAANPYRGLESFEEKHQDLFFGRKQLIQELQDFVEAHPLTVVLGASGTGKSSLVKAGLVPALKQNLDLDGQPAWQVLPIMRPGVAPLKAILQTLPEPDQGPALANLNPADWADHLSTRLHQWQQANPHRRLLLVVDQAEELFSLCRDGVQRQQFLDLLAHLLANQAERFHVVITLRSDFEPQFRNLPLEHDWNEGRFLLRPMGREELRAAIEAPASAKVMYFEPPSLVDRLIDEVTEMPGALPLLSFTLRELFLKYLRNASTRSNRAITAADYEELGGIKQALVNRAEEEYKTLVDADPAFADTIRHVMLRLVATSGTGNTRRQVLLSELDYPEPEGARVHQVLSRFKEARLLVGDTTATEQPYVEPAHDALVEGWPRLLQWLEADQQTRAPGKKSRKGRFRWFPTLSNSSVDASLDEREKLLLQRRLTPAANDWHQAQKAEFLWHADARLPLLKQLKQREPHWFNRTEAEFVTRSLRRKRFNVTLRWASMLGVLALSVGAGLVGNELRRRAVVAENQSEDRRIEAEKRSVQNLVSASKTNLQTDQDLDGLLDALEAARIVQENNRIREDSVSLSQTKFALQQAFYNNRELTHLPFLSEASLSPQGTYVATADETDVKIWSNTSKKFILNGKHGLPDARENEDDYFDLELNFSADEKTFFLRNITYDYSKPDIDEITHSKAWKIEEDSAIAYDSDLPLDNPSPQPQYDSLANNYLQKRDSSCFGNDEGRPINPRPVPKENLVIIACMNGSIALDKIGLGGSTDPQEFGGETYLEKIEIFNNKGGDAYSSISTSSDSSNILVSNEGLSKLWMLRKTEIQKPNIINLGKEEIIDFDIFGSGEKGVAVNAAGSILFWHGDDLDVEKIGTLTSIDRIKARQGNQVPVREQTTIVPLALPKFSPQGDFFAVGGGQAINLFDGEGKAIGLIEHSSEITGLDFHPSENIGISTSRDGILKIWTFQAEELTEVKSIDLQSFITAVRFNLDGSQIAIAYSDKFSGDVDLIGIESKSSSSSAIKIINLDGEEIAKPLNIPYPYTVKIDFLPGGQLLYSGAMLEPGYDFEFSASGQRHPKFVGAGAEIIDTGSNSFVQTVEVSDSPDFRHTSVDPSGEIVSVVVSKNLGHSDTVDLPGLWTLDGEILLDGNFLPDDLSLGNEGFIERSGDLWKFSEGGSAFAILYNLDPFLSSSDGSSYIALWHSDLDRLADMSCELLSNYLSGSLATEEEKQLCSPDAGQIVSTSKATTSILEAVRKIALVNHVEPDESTVSTDDFVTPPWYDPRSWIDPSQQDNQLPFTTSTESETFTPLMPALGSKFDLSGLGLTLSEQQIFYRLHTETTAWDLNGVLSSLALLQSSSNTCVGTFATQFATVLNDQREAGFSQVTPIKRSLNQSSDCQLPLFPFEFSP